jgi:hypothetical protein
MAAMPLKPLVFYASDFSMFGSFLQETPATCRRMLPKPISASSHRRWQHAGKHPGRNSLVTDHRWLVRHRPYPRPGKHSTQNGLQLPTNWPNAITVLCWLSTVPPDSTPIRARFWATRFVPATPSPSFQLKPGLLTADGPDLCGKIRVAKLELTPEANHPADGHQLSSADFSAFLKPRRLNSHKGSFGTAGILGGASSMVGAALLTGRAALKLGCGKVYVGLLEQPSPSVDFLQIELMLRRPGSLLQSYH